MWRFDLDFHLPRPEGKTAPRRPKQQEVAKAAKTCWSPARSLKPGPWLSEQCSYGDPDLEQTQEAYAIRDAWAFGASASPIRRISRDEFQVLTAEKKLVFEDPSFNPKLHDQDNEDQGLEAQRVEAYPAPLPPVEPISEHDLILTRAWEIATEPLRKSRGGKKTARQHRAEENFGLLPSPNFQMPRALSATTSTIF